MWEARDHTITNSLGTGSTGHTVRHAPRKCGLTRFGWRRAPQALRHVRVDREVPSGRREAKKYSTIVRQQREGEPLVDRVRRSREDARRVEFDADEGQKTAIRLFVTDMHLAFETRSAADPSSAHAIWSTTSST